MSKRVSVDEVRKMRDRIRRYATDRGYVLPPVRLFWDCPELKRDHAARPRIFAHAFHKQKQSVCLHPDFRRLPLAKRAGILIHEIGHVCAGPGDAAEVRADDWVREHLGIEIRYDPTDTLEFLDTQDLKALGVT